MNHWNTRVNVQNVEDHSVCVLFRISVRWSRHWAVKWTISRSARCAWKNSTVPDHCRAYTRSVSAASRVTMGAKCLAPRHSVRRAGRNSPFHRTVSRALGLITSYRNWLMLNVLIRVKFVRVMSSSSVRPSCASTVIRSCVRDAVCLIRRWEEELMLLDRLMLYRQRHHQTQPVRGGMTVLHVIDGFELQSILLQC